MKRARVYAVILGLLACAVVASAQTYNVTTTVVNVPGAQILVIGVNKPVVPYTADNKGTVQQMTLDFANNPNKTVEILVQQCGDKPPIVTVVLAGAQPPPEDPNCPRRKLIALYIPGSGTLLVDLYKGTATFTPAPGAGGGGGEGHGPVTFETSFSGGITHASNLSNTSAIEGDVTVYFGPIGGGGGFFRTGNATGQPTGGTPGSTLPPTTSTVKAHGGEFYVIFKPLDVGGRFNVAVLGGGVPFTAYKMSTSTFVVTNPTSGTTTEVVTTNTSKGGFGPYYAARLQVPVTKWLAGQVTVKRIYLRSDNSLNQGITVVTFGGSVSPDWSRALVHLFK